MPLPFTVIEGQDVLSASLAYTLYNLDQQFFPTPWDLNSWENLFEGQERLLVIIHDEQMEVVGFCLFEVSFADYFAHLLKILIIPVKRKNGFSSLLLDFALVTLVNTGYSRFFLEVVADNYAAQRLYHSKGFKIIHQKKNFYGEGRDALIMTKS
jgi:ribosomal-protein-alanine N-acetyltransferase